MNGNVLGDFVSGGNFERMETIILSGTSLYDTKLRKALQLTTDQLCLHQVCSCFCTWCISMKECCIRIVIFYLCGFGSEGHGIRIQEWAKHVVNCIPLTLKQTTQNDHDIRSWKSRSWLGKGGVGKPVNGIPSPDNIDINKWWNNMDNTIAGSVDTHS